MKKVKPATTGMARASGKSAAERNASINPAANIVNLFKVHGRYPQGAAWLHYINAASAREVLDLFEVDGLTGIQLIASTGGTSNRGQQNSGAPALLLLGDAAGEVNHE